MFYVLQHIFICLCAAALLGGLIAWLLRGSSLGQKLTALEEEWSGKLGTLEADKNKATTQWKEAESLAGTWKTKFAGLEGDHTRLQSDFAGVSGRLPMLETAIAGWTAKAATWDSDRNRMHADLKACADARATLEVQMADWTSRGKAWDTERVALRSNLNKAVADDAADDAAYEKTITALRSEVAGLQGRLKNAEIAANDWQVKHTTIDGQLKTVIAERDRAMSGYKKAVADDAVDDAAYEKTIGALRAEMAAVQTHLTAVTKERDQAQAGYKKAVADDQADDSAYEKTIALLRGELAKLTQERDQARAGFNRAVKDDAADDAQYEKVIAQLRGEMANLKAAAKKATDDDTIEDANFRNTIEGLKSEVAGLQAKLKREQQADREDDAAYEQTIAGLKAQLATLTQERDQARGGQAKAVADDRADDAVYEARIADLNTALAAARAQAQSFEAKLAAPAAMAAAAGAGAAASSVVDEGRYSLLNKRFESFVMRTQREGWGDIERIEGIGPVYGQKLRSTGIAWVKDLLEEGASAAGRTRIAEETGIKRELILKWVNAADLLRITGVTPDWAELLEASGVDTVKELRTRVPENLQKKMAETNPVGNYARTVPDTDTVRGWVEAAKKMEPKVTH